MKPYFLCITNSLLIYVFLFSIYKKYKNIHEQILTYLLFQSIIISQLFWINPIKNSDIHLIDLIIAKISIIYFIFYTLLLKKLNIYLYISYWFIIGGIIISFYMSHFYSSQNWCCEKHILYHGLLHIFVFIGSFYAFL
jgi:hypothetical protein